MKKDNANICGVVALVSQVLIMLICYFNKIEFFNTLATFVSISLLFAISLTIISVRNIASSDYENIERQK